MQYNTREYPCTKENTLAVYYKCRGVCGRCTVVHVCNSFKISFTEGAEFSFTLRNVVNFLNIIKNKKSEKKEKKNKFSSDLVLVGLAD